jgi:hypothetical protein
MRKLVAALLPLVAAAPAWAQIPQNTVLVSGTINYHKGDQDPNGAVNSFGYHGSSFEFSPSVGYFVAPNLAVGLDAGLLLSRADIAPSQSSSAGYSTSLHRQRIISVGPMARYYHFVGEQAAFFGQGGAGYISRSQDYELTGFGMRTLKSNGFYAQLSPGFAFFPTPKFGLEVSLQGLTYQYARYKQTISGTLSNAGSLDAGIGLRNLQLGAAFYLGR